MKVTGRETSHAKATGLIITLLLSAGCAKEVPPRVMTLQVTAIAYNSTAAQTDGSPAVGAWGEQLYPGVKAIAVSRDLEARGLIRGTPVHIEGLDGAWLVADRMAARHENTIDLYLGQDVLAARKWGRRQVVIHWIPLETEG